jgi:hypothetical protein
MADQSSGTPRPLGARPFARPLAGTPTDGQPKDMKSAPARPALPPFAPVPSGMARAPLAAAENGALLPEAVASVALEPADRAAQTPLATEPHRVPVESEPESQQLVAADAPVPESNVSEQGMEAQTPPASADYPVVRSRDMWTPEWTPVVVPQVTEESALQDAQAVAGDTYAHGAPDSEDAAYEPPALRLAVPFGRPQDAVSGESEVPLFLDAESEPHMPGTRAVPLGHWTDAPSAEEAHGTSETRDLLDRFDGGTPATSMEDVRGSLDERLRTPPEQVTITDDRRNARAEAPVGADMLTADADTASKERQYADVLEAVASRVRAGEIQLPVAPGRGDEAAVLAAVLASLLSSR